MKKEKRERKGQEGTHVRIPKYTRALWRREDPPRALASMISKGIVVCSNEEKSTLFMKKCVRVCECVSVLVYVPPPAAASRSAGLD